MKSNEAQLSDEPSVVDSNGTKRWYKEATTILHRLDGPAKELADGTREWWVNGERHRSDGGPAAIYADGDKEWWENGERHRSDGGPAIEFASGRKEWWVNGKRHRLDGPAIERADGSRIWWVNDRYLDDSVLALFKQAISKTTPSSKLSELSHYENEAISQGAAHNPNCPLEDQIEWTLTHEEGLGG